MSDAADAYGSGDPLPAESITACQRQDAGIAGSSADYATAFLFYDRLLAPRSQTRLLPVILGRVMAHEIAHLLLPQEEHAQAGLMRGQWSADDLQLTSVACLGLPARSVQFLQREALRRVRAATRAREQ